MDLKNETHLNQKSLLGQGTPTALQFMGIGLDFIAYVDTRVFLKVGRNLIEIQVAVGFLGLRVNFCHESVVLLNSRQSA